MVSSVVTLWGLVVVTGLVHLATAGLALSFTRLRGHRSAWWVTAVGFAVLGLARIATAPSLSGSAVPVRTADVLLAGLHLAIGTLLLIGVLIAGRSGREAVSRLDEIRVLNDELTRGEKRYKFLVDRLPEAFLVLESDRIVFASRACRSVLGLAPDEAIGRDLEDSIHPRWREQYRRRHDVNPSTGSLGIQRLELEIVRADGPLRWAELRFQLTTWGERPAEIVLASDLTDRRRAEQRLQQLNQVLTRLGNDTRENIERLTAACGELLGASCALYNRLEGGKLRTEGAWQAPADMPLVAAPEGHLCFDVIRRGEADTPLVVRNLPESTYGRTDPIVARYGLRTYAGHPVSFAGRTVGSLCVVYEENRDFDESDARILQVVARAVGTEEDRRAAEELQRAIYEISEAAHLADNLQELFVSIHAVVGRLMEARNLYIALHDLVTDLVSFPYWSDEQDGPPKPRKPGRGLTEYVLRTSRPTLVSPQRFEELATEGEVESIGAPSIDWLGVPLVVGEATIGVLVVQTYTEGTRYGQRDQDILTFVSRQIAVAIERKRLEDRLRLSQRIEALGQLAGGVAHDFNNLLMAILGSTELLQKRHSQDGEAGAELDTIHRSVRRASELTRGLLAFARRQVLEAVPLDLDQVIPQFLPILRRVIPENISIDFRPNGRLGTVRADRNQIDQILMNLCVNSRDAMSGGGRIAIQTRNVTLGDDYVTTHPWSRPGDYVLLSVRDNGAGMDAHTLRHIFEPFFTTREPGKGSGLGLATVYGIVKQHDGLIDVDSQVGGGTTVNVYLPRVEGVPSELEPTDSRPVSGGSETILVVEDEAEVRRIVLEVLAGLGYRVLEASDGVEALEQLRSGTARVDLVITDVIMPRMGGRELFEAAAALTWRPRFLFSSGYGETLVNSGVAGSERAAFIAKPYGIDDLARKVRELLERDDQ
ncbi:MAG: GAF domain-containing protein [Acidobacteria bacterium]|nr:GAF domain-containing protein [Acidobacteriota bacterium]